MTDYTSVESTQPLASHDDGDTRPPTLPPPPPPRRRRLPTLLLIVLVALVAAAVAYPAGQRAGGDGDGTTQIAGTSQQQDDAAAGQEAPAALDAPSPVPDIARTVLPSVAQVEVGQGSGSAVIYRSDGYLVTNNHVVTGGGQGQTAQSGGAGSIQVILADGVRRDAEVVGTAPVSDLAVLRIDEQDLPAASFSDEVPEIGTTAVAIGSPFGLDATVTSGIVSALDRELQGGGESLGGLIQTDAAINPGNSGGALADDRGRIIGINTAIFSNSGTNSGVGFAVPSTTVTALADQLIESGEVNPGFLGIEGQDVTAEAADAFGVPDGAVIANVQSGSAAADAGLQAEDVIVGFEGEDIDSMLALSSRVILRQPGDEVTITYVRNGQERETTATLGERPSSLGSDN